MIRPTKKTFSIEHLFYHFIDNISFAISFFLLIFFFFHLILVLYKKKI